MIVKSRKISNSSRLLNVFNEHIKVASVLIDGTKDIPVVSIYGSSENLIVDFKSKVNKCNTNDYLSKEDNYTDMLLRSDIDYLKGLNINECLNVTRHKIKDTHYLYCFIVGNVRFSVSIYSNWRGLNIEVGESADIRVDGITYLSYIHEIKNKYPNSLYSIISKYQEYVGFENNMYSVDLRFSGNHIATLYLDELNNDDNMVCLRYDTSKLPNDLSDMGVDSNMLYDIRNSFASMCLAIDELDLRFSYSHNQSDFLWGWSDVIVPIDKLNEEVLLKISEIMFEHEDFIKECDLKINTN